MLTLPVKIGDLEITYRIAITDAPQVYDGFGTLSLYESKAPCGELIGLSVKKRARLVLIRDEHLIWQTQRYASGMFTIDHDDHPALKNIDWIAERLYQRLICREEELDR